MKIDMYSMESPVGPIAVACEGDTVLSLHMQEATERSNWKESYSRTSVEKAAQRELTKRFPKAAIHAREGASKVTRALSRYFRGDTRALDALKVETGGTAFQKRIWDGLRKIPAGKTLTYGELAVSVGSPKAFRAAGGAVGRNPVALIVPCHRIIGSDKKLTGFGGGLARKRWLLEHEGAHFRSG